MSKNSKRRESLFTKLQQALLKIDGFGETESLKIDGSATYNSCFGATLSILLAFALFVYSFQKGVTWYDREDYILQTNVKKNALDPE